MRQRIYAGLSDPSLLVDAISDMISCVGPYFDMEIPISLQKNQSMMIKSNNTVRKRTTKQLTCSLVLRCHVHSLSSSVKKTMIR